MAFSEKQFTEFQARTGLGRNGFFITAVLMALSVFTGFEKVMVTWAFNGRNNLQWDDRFEMDIKYIENMSFFLDVMIILDTVLKVLKHTDITVRGTTKVKDYGPYSVLKEESNGGKKMADMTYSEIGSYFWLDGEKKILSAGGLNWLPSVEDSTFTFSGRNAIDVALRDILNNKSINRVLAPSYCCVSMLQPFIDRGIRVEFYNVGYQNGIFTYAVPETDARTGYHYLS